MLWIQPLPADHVQDLDAEEARRVKDEHRRGFRAHHAGAPAVQLSGPLRRVVRPANCVMRSHRPHWGRTLREATVVPPVDAHAITGVPVS